MEEASFDLKWEGPSLEKGAREIAQVVVSKYPNHDLELDRLSVFLWCYVATYVSSIS